MVLVQEQEGQGLQVEEGMGVQEQPTEAVAEVEVEQKIAQTQVMELQVAQV